MIVYRNGQADVVASGVHDSQPEPPRPSPLDGVAPGKAKGETRPHVRYTRCSTRTLDDFINLAGGTKQIEDRVVEAGLIPGDSEKQITSTFTQKKVSKKDVGTLIEIEYPD